MTSSLPWSSAFCSPGSFGVVPPTDPDEPGSPVGARADQEADKRAAAEEARLVEERRESALRADRERARKTALSVDPSLAGAF